MSKENIQQLAGFARDYLREQKIDLPFNTALEFAAKLADFKDLHHGLSAAKKGTRASQPGLLQIRTLAPRHVAQLQILHDDNFPITKGTVLGRYTPHGSIILNMGDGLVSLSITSYVTIRAREIGSSAAIEEANHKIPTLFEDEATASPAAPRQSSLAICPGATAPAMRASDLLKNENEIRHLADVAGTYKKLLGYIEGLQGLLEFEQALKEAGLTEGSITFSEDDADDNLYGLEVGGPDAGEFERHFDQSYLRDLADMLTQAGEGEFFTVDISFNSVRKDFILPTIKRLKDARVEFDLPWLQAACEDPEPEEAVLPEDQAQALRLPRDRMVEILEGAGIQCYDSETAAVLAEAIRVNILDGTIDSSVLFDESG